MNRFQYLVVEHELQKMDRSDEQDALNKLGELGWELVAVHVVNRSDGPYSVFYLKGPFLL